MKEIVGKMEIEDLVKIVVWCDYDWCFFDELEEFGRSKSDDFKFYFAPVGYEEEFVFDLSSKEYQDWKEFQLKNGL